VVEVGSGASRVKVGDLVVTMVRRPCDHDDCLACRSDRQDFCYTGDFSERGIKTTHGLTVTPSTWTRIFHDWFVVDDQKYKLHVCSFSVWLAAVERAFAGANEEGLHHDTGAQ